MKWIASNVLGAIIGIFIVYQILMFLVKQVGSYLPSWLKTPIMVAFNGISNGIAPFVGHGLFNNLLTMIIFIALLGGIGKALTSNKS